MGNEPNSRILKRGDAQVNMDDSSRSQMKDHDPQGKELKDTLSRRARLVDNFVLSVGKYFSKTPRRLEEAMRYSLEAGGKRIRPVLCMTCAALFGLKEEQSLPFACAIEMIHTYSLIHDDLPAMDNDDLRRGKPSSHKAFGEAMAILAGDGLLTDAFAVASQCGLPAGRLLKALNKLAMAAGSSGMVGGQVLDMEYTDSEDVGINKIKAMQSLKTGAIMEASCVCGAILADAAEEDVQLLSRYGGSLGILFQLMDDILDATATTEELGKPAGSDEREGKKTWVTLLGIEKSRELLSFYCLEAAEAVGKFESPDGRFLLELPFYLARRAGRNG